MEEMEERVGYGYVQYGRVIYLQLLVETKLIETTICYMIIIVLARVEKWLSLNHLSYLNRFKYQISISVIS